jgi:hypothetical protein
MVGSIYLVYHRAKAQKVGIFAVYLLNQHCHAASPDCSRNRQAFMGNFNLNRCCLLQQSIMNKAKMMVFEEYK